MSETNEIIVKCEVCGMELANKGTGWYHPQPVDPEFPHRPQPVPA